MARIAVPLVLAFVALLVFIGWMVSTKRTRRATALDDAKQELDQYRAVLDDVYDIAFDGADVDPSAELIIMRINDFKKKELS